MSEKIKILNMIEIGELSPEEGAQLLEQLLEEEAKADKNFDPLSILNKIENGEISSEEGVRLLQSSKSKSETFQANSQERSDDNDPSNQKPPSLSEDELNKWKHWWTYPLYFGIGLSILAAYWMNSAYQNAGYGFWFFFSWFPLLIGILLMALSWISQTGTWLHVRVKSEHQRVAISFPAPLSFAAFVLRYFGQYIPHMGDTSLDEIIVVLKDTADSGNPFYIHVNEGEDGEQVEVFLG